MREESVLNEKNTKKNRKRKKSNEKVKKYNVKYSSQTERNLTSKCGIKEKNRSHVSR